MPRNDSMCAQMPKEYLEIFDRTPYIYIYLKLRTALQI
jgi:hypothetical protein